MSEKRFTYLTGAMGVLFYDGDEMIPYPKVCGILNKVDEQQDTICKLQDFIGETDAENIRLRQENKKLKEEKQRLIYHLNKEPKR